VPCGI